MSEPNKLNLILTRPALDRLLGDDSELTVQIKYAAAKEILEKHIEPAIRLMAVQDIKTRLMHEVNTSIEKELGLFTPKRWNIDAKYQPTPIVKEAIDNYVSGVVGIFIQQFLHEAMPKFEAKFQAAIDTEVRAYVKKVAYQELETVLEGLTAKVQSSPLFTLGKLSERQSVMQTASQLAQR